MWWGFERQQATHGRTRIEPSLVVGSACSCLAGKDSDGSGDARVASAVRKILPILVGMPEKMVNNSMHTFKIIRRADSER